MGKGSKPHKTKSSPDQGVAAWSPSPASQEDNTTPSSSPVSMDIFTLFQWIRKRDKAARVEREQQLRKEAACWKNSYLRTQLS